MAESKWKKRYEALKGRGRRAIGSHKGGMKTTAIEAAAGAALALGEGKIKETVKQLNQPYYWGGALVVASIPVKKKRPNLGSGLAFMGGYAIGRDYIAEQQKKQQQNSPAGTAAQVASQQANQVLTNIANPGGTTMGFGDAFALPAGAVEPIPYMPAAGVVNAGGVVDASGIADEAPALDDDIDSLGLD